MRSKGTRRYVNVLQKIVKVISNSPTREIGLSSAGVVKQENKIITYPPKKKWYLKVGETVRISAQRGQFQEEYVQNAATDEIFLISNCIRGDTYNLLT